MPKHARKSAQDQIALNPIVGLLIAVLAIGAVVLGVIKVTSPSPSGGGSSAQEAAAGEAANGQSAANVSTKEGDDTTTATTGNQSGEQKKDDKKSEESKSDNKDSKDNKDDKSGSGDSKASGDKNADKTEGGGSSSNSGTSAESGDASGSASGSGGDSGVYGDTTPIIVVAPNAEGWYTGEACATCVEESGTITASEIPFDDSVPQIGLDTGFPNYAAHLGGYAEVKYEGKTVKAQVVDAGAYNGGPAGIALNPGVFEQFGVSSVYDWGRRNVSYRFV